MERRKEELEKKRQKLAELRRAREERRHVQREVEKPPTGPTGLKTKDDVDDLVQSILKERSRTPVAAASGGDSDGGSDKGTTITPPVSIPAQLTSPSASVPQSPAVPTGGRFIPEFSNFEAVILDIAPKEVVFYSKEVQTSTTSFAPPPPSEEEIRAKLEKEFQEQEKARLAAQEEERIKQEAARKKIEQAKELNENERETIMSSAEFGKFIERSTKIMERALNEKYDFMIDYSISQNVDDGDDESGLRVKLVCTFFDDRWSQRRSVTDVNWSHKHPELSVASYNKNPMAMNEPDGIVLVWNLHSLNTPEYVFHSQSDVLTTAFSPFHPTIIIGGTYSGQIVLWDMRAKSLPVLKSPLSSAGHTHPVYSMQMVGTQNAHNLITASTDGLICSWQLDMLAQPQDTLELVHPNHSKTDEVSVTAIGFPDNETTAFWVGTEEGNVYQANRFDRAGSKAGINQYDYYKGHWGPITGLQFHPLVGPVDFSDLFITSSVDWTVKLWRAKSSSKPNTTATDIKPLYSFEGADDYVYDVKWSPNHPALFGSVDGTGKFSLWNLNVDTEVPVVSTEVVGQKALNKINWDKDGKKVAIGSSDGRVHVYDIGEMSHPRSDEWANLQKNVAEMIATTESEHTRATTK